MAAPSGNREQDLRDLLALARQHGISSDDLDEIVHEVVSQQATQINNGGLEAQLSYLIDPSAPHRPARCCTPTPASTANRPPITARPARRTAVTDTTAYRVRHPLTDAEMAAIRAAIDAAGSPVEILTATVQALFGALLAA